MHVCELSPSYVRSIAPYQPGKPISEVAREYGLVEANIIKLASNENPLQCGVLDHASKRGIVFFSHEEMTKCSAADLDLLSPATAMLHAHPWVRHVSADLQQICSFLCRTSLDSPVSSLAFNRCFR